MIIDGYIYKNCSFNLNQLPLYIQKDIVEKIYNRYYSPPQKYLSYNDKPYNTKAYLSDILFLNKQYDLLDLLIEQKFSDNWEAYLNFKKQINNKINNSSELEKEQLSLFKTYNIFDFLDKDNPIKSLENFLNHYNKQKSLTARISTRNIVENIKDCFKCLQINKKSNDFPKESHIKSLLKSIINKNIYTIIKRDKINKTEYLVVYLYINSF